VSRDRDRNSVLAMLTNLGWPLIVGLAACSLFYAAIYQGVLGPSFFQRYFAGHPVSFFATGLFFVGLAALLLKSVNIAGQFASMRSIAFDVPRTAVLPVDQCGALLDELDELPASARHSYLGNRLREALEYLERRGSAEALDDEVKYLADLDGSRQHDSYALVRIVIWAIPMLGFLGTVVGITRALGDLDPEMLTNAIQKAMDGLLAGLYVAFDTTAQALSLSMLLMFVQFFVDRLETQLLSNVDTRVNEELVGRFETVGSAQDPHLASVQRMAQEVIKTSETLVARQAEVWKTTLDVANARWTEGAEGSLERMRAALGASLDQSLGKFAQQLSDTQEQATDELRRRWEQWQTTLSNTARMLQAQQQEMVKQGDVMARVLEATVEITKLEAVLNKNLRSLAGAKNFEDTVMSLAAAIHLLNTRLGAVDDHTHRFGLKEPGSQGRAA